MVYLIHINNVRGKYMADTIISEDLIGFDKGIFPISAIAEIIGIHVRTLRIYDDMNLLSPKRTKKNHRLYSLRDVERAKFINYLTTDLGINLMGVKLIIYLFEEQNVPIKNYIKKVEEIKGNLDIVGEKNYKKRGRKKAV